MGWLQPRVDTIVGATEHEVGGGGGRPSEPWLEEGASADGEERSREEGEREGVAEGVQTEGGGGGSGGGRGGGGARGGGGGGGGHSK